MIEWNDSIYISYHRDNQYSALLIYKVLREKGFDVFIDISTLADDGGYAPVILNQIRSRSVYILCATSEYIAQLIDKRSWLYAETDTAFKDEKYIIIILFENVDYIQVQEAINVESHWGAYNIITFGSEPHFDTSMQDLLTLLKTRKAPTLMIGNIWGASNDNISTNRDELNYRDYIAAFARLIISEYTQLPLTIGIFGAWGSGKSFMLEGIASELNTLGNNSVLCHVIHFNAWEYNSSEIVWTGLVRSIMDRIENLPSGRRWRFLRRLKRNITHDAGDSRGVYIVLPAAVLTVTILALWLQRFIGIDISQTLLRGTGLLALFAIGTQVIRSGFTPLSQWVTNMIRDRDYGKQIGYMTEIRKDMEYLAALLKENERIVIMIDDLDRCEPQKTVEVLQAIKLLLNFDSFIVCLGIDVRIVTLAIEKHYEGLLGKAGASGYEYLDKIIQIPFQIPTPTTEEVKNFLTKQMGEPKSKAMGESTQSVRTEEAEIDSTRYLELNENLKERQPNSVGFTKIPFTWDELRVFHKLADAQILRANPRHLKRMINIYRLVRSLAIQKHQALSPRETIYWLVLCAQWSQAAHLMMRQYEKLDVETAQSYDNRILIELWEQVKSGYKNYCKLDGEITTFERLLYLNVGWLDYRGLNQLRRYTINFLPVIEGVVEEDVP